LTLLLILAQYRQAQPHCSAPSVLFGHGSFRHFKRGSFSLFPLMPAISYVTLVLLVLVQHLRDQWRFSEPSNRIMQIDMIPDVKPPSHTMING
jgi:hypothetical protein